jgi:hypothetical protein
MAQQWLVLKGAIPPHPRPVQPLGETTAAAVAGGAEDSSSSSSSSPALPERWSREWSLAALACLQRVMLGLGGFADGICNTCQVRGLRGFRDNCRGTEFKRFHGRAQMYVV